jgi:Domain of unknown function (DUF4116)
MSDLRARLNKILDLHGQALSEVISQREPKSPEAQLSAKDLILRFAENDPTDGKSRTQWMVKTYIQDEQFKLEDLGRAHAALSAFERFKRKLPREQRELLRFKSLRELEVLVDPFVKAEERARLTRDLSTATGRELRRLEELKARDESIFLQEKTGIPTIAVPMTEFSSKWWGRGTKWCTAAEKNNAFATHHQNSPLIVIICPDGEKFQIHVTKNIIQFMDNTDNTVGEETIQERWNEFESLLYWAIQQNGRALRFIPENKRTLELCRLAVEQNGFALYFVPRDLKRNRFEDKKTSELCRLAVEQNGLTLKYMSENQMTPELCCLAVQRTGGALQYVPEDYKTPELYRIAVEQDGEALQYVSESQRTHEICRIAVQQRGEALGFVPDDEMTLELCRLAVQTNGGALEYVPEDYKTPELCRIAIEQKGEVLSLLYEDHRTPELCQIAIEQNGYALQYVPKDKRTEELCRIAVVQNGRALFHVPTNFITPELCHLAVEQNGLALDAVPTDNKTPELCRLAVQQNGDALKYVPEDKRNEELLALISPSQPSWHPDVLQGLGQQSQISCELVVNM